MTDVGIAFTIMDEGKKSPPGCTKSSGHLIFDFKMDFTRKAMWVKDGHRSPVPTTSNIPVSFHVRVSTWDSLTRH